MERLILEYITDRFGKYKTTIQNEHLVLYVDEGFIQPNVYIGLNAKWFE
jgi:hypothetical protein